MQTRRLRQGETIGNFRIVGVLPSTRYADLYQGHALPHAGVLHPALIRVFKQHLSADAQATCLGDAPWLTRMNHPNILRVFDIGVSNDRLFVVLEQVDGLTGGQLLSAVRARGQVLPVGLAVFICHELLRGLAAVHACPGGVNAPQLVHGGLTAESLFLSRTGDVKLLDLADVLLAKHLPADSHEALSLTAVHLAPEQAEGKAADPRSDIFSAFLLAWELLAGAPSDRGGSRTALLRQALGRPLPLPSTQRHDIDAALDTLIARGLSPKPEDRYASASDAAGALGKWLQTQTPRPDARTLAALVIQLTDAGTRPAPTFDETPSLFSGTGPPHKTQAMALDELIVTEPDTLPKEPPATAAPIHRKPPDRDEPMAVVDTEPAKRTVFIRPDELTVSAPPPNEPAQGTVLFDPSEIEAPSTGGLPHLSESSDARSITERLFGKARARHSWLTVARNLLLFSLLGVLLGLVLGVAIGSWNRRIHSVAEPLGEQRTVSYGRWEVRLTRIAVAPDQGPPALTLTLHVRHTDRPLSPTDYEIQVVAEDRILPARFAAHSATNSTKSPPQTVQVVFDLPGGRTSWPPTLMLRLSPRDEAPIQFPLLVPDAAEPVTGVHG